ncbi:MAG: hypothetical protein WAQ07_06080 [Candidatus Omnitrophota bacterium]
MADYAKKAIYPALIFKEAWGIVLKSFKKLSAIFLIFYIPFLILALLSLAIAGDQSKILTLISMILSLLVSVPLIFATCKVAQGEGVSIVEGILSGMKKYLLRYIALNLLMALFLIGIIFAGFSVVVVLYSMVGRGSILLAFTTLIIPAIIVTSIFVYFMIRWALAGVVCIAEGLGPIKSLKRSTVLIKNYVTPVVGEYTLIMVTLLLASIPYTAWNYIFNRQYYSAEVSIVSAAVNNIIIHSIVTPFIIAVMVVMYKKLKEAIETNVCP